MKGSIDMEEIKKLLVAKYGEVEGGKLFASLTDSLGDKQLFLHKKDQKVVVDEGKFITKERLDEVGLQRDGYKGQIEKLESELVKLRKAAEGVPELSKQIETLQATVKTEKETAALKITEMAKVLAIKEGLLDAHVDDPEYRALLLPKFDLAKIELDDKGKVKGFDELLKPIKATAIFFGKTTRRGTGTSDNIEQDHDHVELSELEQKLAQARKAGDTAAIVHITREIAAQQQQT
jgi:hypothetical protein